MMQPCITCGIVSSTSKCANCKSTTKRLRPSPTARGYDSAWQKLSKQLRLMQPYCSWCKSTQDLTVDHIKPLSKGGTHDLTNLRVLCRTCNSGRRD